MKEFDEKLKEAAGRYVKEEYGQDAGHRYSPDAEERLAEILNGKSETRKRRNTMKNRTFTKRLTAAVVCALLAVSSAVVYAASPAVREYINMLFLKEDSAGPLTEVPEGYIGIYTAEDLDNVRNDLNGKYILMNDLDLAGAAFVPIGSSDEPFTGIFNGNGHVISGLIVDGSYDYAGLFGYCRREYTTADGVERYQQTIKRNPEEHTVEGGIIKNLGLVNGSVTSYGECNRVYAGGIAGYADYLVGCYVENFTVTADVGTDTYSEYLGGLAGNAYFIDSCYSYADVKLIGADNDDTVYAGGIAGNSFSCVTSYFGGTIDSCGFPDYGVTNCQEYMLPVVIGETAYNKLLERFRELENGEFLAMKFNSFYCPSHYMTNELPFQDYMTTKNTDQYYYLLDPGTLAIEFRYLTEDLALAFPDNTFRAFCMENHIKSGYYACYDLRDTPDCTFDGFDFDFIWYDRESPKLRLFKNSTAHTSAEHASEILDRYSDYMDAAGQPVSDAYGAYDAYQNGWIKP